MFARFTKASILARDQRALFFAYTCFAISSCAVGVIVLRADGTWFTTGIYRYWTIVAVVIAGPAALRMAQGWIGLPGALGFARALIGSVVSLFLAAVIGGSLMLPGYGTIYAPLIVLTVMLTKPWVALIWLAGVCVAHRVIIQEDAARQARLRLQQQQAMLSLSPLSQTYFYRK